MEEDAGRSLAEMLREAAGGDDDKTDKSAAGRSASECATMGGRFSTFSSTLQKAAIAALRSTGSSGSRPPPLLKARTRCESAEAGSSIAASAACRRLAT